VFYKAAFRRLIVLYADRVDVLQLKGTQQQDDDQISVSPKVSVQEDSHRVWGTERGDGLEGKRPAVDIVLGEEVRYGLLDFRIGKPFGNIFGVSMQGEKVVKLRKGSCPGSPHMDGRITEFSRECFQV
jgi:hypothetical protein